MGATGWGARSVGVQEKTERWRPLCDVDNRWPTESPKREASLHSAEHDLESLRCLTESLRSAL